MISQRVMKAFGAEMVTPIGEAYRFKQALAKVVEAAERASAEIQSQHQMWPGEVDNLAAALKALELALKDYGC